MQGEWKHSSPPPRARAMQATTGMSLLLGRPCGELWSAKCSLHGHLPTLSRGNASRVNELYFHAAIYRGISEAPPS